MAENNNVLNDTSELKVRRDKLTNLYETGKNPFEITKYDVTHTSVNAIKEYSDNEEALLAEGKELTVRVAGRMVGKRVMGKASFAHLLDGDGKIQLYVSVTISVRRNTQASRNGTWATLSVCLVFFSEPARERFRFM